MNKYWLLLLFPLVLFFWYLLGRGDSAPVVHFVSVQKMTIESTVATNGKVEPVQWAAARAETAGVVKSILVERGQTVSTGQELISLDTQSAGSELAAAVARLQEAQAQAAVVSQGGKEASVASLDDSLRSAQAAVETAQRNLDAMNRLASAQAATKFQVQDAKDALERAQLQVSAIQSQRKTLVTGGDKTVAIARVKDAQAAVDLARHRLDFSVVRSPVKGTLYQFDLKPGAYLQPGDLAGLIGNLDQVKVSIYIDEPDLGRVGLGMPVSIAWDAQPGRKWSGRVDKLPTQIIALGTRSVGEVSTVVDNPNHDLLPGVSVNVTVTSKIVRDAIGIPKAALHNMRGQSGVFKLTGKTITWTPVVAGITDINNVQIESGLDAQAQVADRVVEPSDAELKSGLRIKPQVN